MVRAGLMCGVFRPADGGDCSLGGISSRYEHVILTAECIEGVFNPSEKMPEVRLVEIPVSESRTHLVAVPAEFFSDPDAVEVTREDFDTKAGPICFGGCFVHTSDGRFPNHYPIPLWDRRETWDQYRQLSE